MAAARSKTGIVNSGVSNYCGTLADKHCLFSRFVVNVRCRETLAVR